MRLKSVLTAADAERVVVAALREATAQGWPVSVAVVDDAGFVIRIERMDGAPFPSPDVAAMKARTAALTRQSTKRLEEVAKDRPGTLLLPGRLPVQGGLPMMHDGACVGGLGVSGVQSHEDEQIAAAGLAAL